MKKISFLVTVLLLTLGVIGCDQGERKVIKLEIQKDKESYYAKLNAQQENINKIWEEYKDVKGHNWTALQKGMYSEVNQHEADKLTDEYIAKLKEHIASQAQYINLLENNIHTLTEVLSKP